MTLRSSSERLEKSEARAATRVLMACGSSLAGPSAAGKPPGHRLSLVQTGPLQLTDSEVAMAGYYSENSLFFPRSGTAERNILIVPLFTLWEYELSYAIETQCKAPKAPY